MFTPGPWKAVQRRNSSGQVAPDASWEIQAECGHVIADLRWNGRNAANGKDNARLIAAAPDLLAAIVHIIRVTNLRGSGSPLETQAIEAITKATGKPPA